MPSAQQRVPQRPFEHAPRIEELVNGTPFFIYSISKGITSRGFFPNLQDDLFEDTKILTIVKDKDPTQPDHKVRCRPVDLGLAPDDDGWHADVFIVSTCRIFEKHYQEFIHWLAERKQDRVARDTLRRLGFDDLI